MNYFKKILIALVSSALILVLFEVYLRSQDWAPIPLTYEGKISDRVQGGRIECMNPKVSRFYFSQPTNPYPNCVFYSINNLGFRNAYPVEENKPEGINRVVFIGDSLTFGFGVLEEDTFIVKLEQFWKSQGKKVEVINAAEPGAGIPNYRDMIKNKVLKLHPNMIVIGINLNDILDFPTSLIIENVSKKFSWSLREYSQLVNFICYAFEKNMSAEANIQNMLNSYSPKRLKEFEDFVHETNELAKKQNTKLFVMIHPVFYDFNKYAFTKIHDDLSGVLKKENIPYHDFLTDFKNENAEELWITKNDQHPNEVAHEKYFEVLKTAIQ